MPVVIIVLLSFLCLVNVTINFNLPSTLDGSTKTMQFVENITDELLTLIIYLNREPAVPAY